jgi:hypothetical protein
MSASSTNSTIKEMADKSRSKLLLAMSEAKFARLCMEFDQRIASGNVYVRYLGVLKVLNQDRSLQTQMLGLIWLDGYGYGHIRLAELELELYLLREHGLGGAGLGTE